MYLRLYQVRHTSKRGIPTYHQLTFKPNVIVVTMGNVNTDIPIIILIGWNPAK